MTFPRSWRYPNICSNCLLTPVILLVSALSFSCASLSETLYPTPEPEESGSTIREKKRQKVVSSQFEWAVQNYEAGEYDLAIPQFRKLKSFGSSLSGYELVPYYLGMSLFQRKNYPEASAELEFFLKNEKNLSESQDARIALLSIYEKTHQWGRVLGLAAETDKLTLFQDKRAFLKLVWARALLEMGEVKGARAVLKDSAQYLDSHSAKRPDTPDLDRDLWGRYYYTNFLLDSASCLTTPKEIGSGKGRKRLYQPWLESSVDCFRRSISQIEKNLSESGWTPLALAELNRQIGSFGEKIETFLSQEKRQLARRRALEGLARQNIYRLLSRVDESLKFFENQQLAKDSLEQVRKRLDLLLVSLARPS